MASQSMINECILDLENQFWALDRDKEVLENEIDLERLVGMPGSIYKENVHMWKEYKQQLEKNIGLMLEIQKILNAHV